MLGVRPPGTWKQALWSGQQPVAGGLRLGPSGWRVLQSASTPEEHEKARGTSSAPTACSASATSRARTSSGMWLSAASEPRGGSARPVELRGPVMRVRVGVFSMTLKLPRLPLSWGCFWSCILVPSGLGGDQVRTSSSAKAEMGRECLSWEARLCCWPGVWAFKLLGEAGGSLVQDLLGCTTALPAPGDAAVFWEEMAACGPWLVGVCGTKHQGCTVWPCVCTEMH